MQSYKMIIKKPEAADVGERKQNAKLPVCTVVIMI